MAAAVQRRFVGCRACGVLTPIVLPERDDAPDVVEAYLQDWYGFFAAHGGHVLVEVAADAGAPATGGPVWDPLAELVFAARCGDEPVVVRAGRASIDEPRRFRFEPGEMLVAPGVVEIDEADVRRALDMELQPHAQRAAQIDALLTVLHDSVDGLAAEELEIAYEDVDDPEVSIAPLPEQAFQRVLDASSRIFDDGELARVARFLAENRGGDGLLALRVRRRAIPTWASG